MLFRSETGLANSEYNVWVGMMANARTPRPVLQRLHDEMVKALQTAEVQETFRKLVAEPMIMTLEQFDAMLKSEYAMNAALVKAAGVKAN